MIRAEPDQPAKLPGAGARHDVAEPGAGIGLEPACDQGHHSSIYPERAGLPAFDQVLTPRWRFVGLGPEVRDPGDQPAGELEERHAIVGASFTGPGVEAPLEPHHPVPLVGDDDLGPQMPVAGILLVEPQVAVAPADPLPGLRDLVD